nr:F-box/kelch-repeat protein At3g06240-like [Quercus suber]
MLYICGPSVRKFKKLPHTCLEKLNNVTLGFAYCSENNDYKVVRTSQSTFLSPSEIEMYTLSSDSWRRVEISVTADVRFSKDLLSPIPSVSGALHWITETNIVAFDVNSEKFRKLALPDVSIYGRQLQRTCLASFRGKLAFIGKLTFIGQSSFQYSIWVMTDYGVAESWNKLFVVPFERLACWVLLTDYGSLMVGYINNPFDRQGMKYALIDTETLQEKKDPDIQHPSFIASFMESLVLLDGTNVESY